MDRREGVVTFAGNPVTLIGTEIKVGDIAPDFTAINSKLEEVSLHDFKGKKIIISAVPSVDTSVCELQTKRFNEEASKLDNTVILTLSCDLPFAQGRFCAADGIDNIVVLSDHRNLDFGHKYGLELEGLRLLERAVFVVGEDGKVAYVEYVSEVTNHPDYDKAIEAAKAL